MRKTLSMLLACTLIALVSGCGKSAEESAMSDMVSKMKEQVSILKGVTDEASAKAAGPKLKAINEEMAKVAKAGKEAAGSTKPEDAAKLQERYGKEMTDAGMELIKEHTRIAGMPAVNSALDAASK